MAKFNIEVELDWMEEESIDERLMDEIESHIKNHLAEKTLERVMFKLEKEMEETLKDAADKVREKVDDFIKDTCSEKIGNMMVPYKENSWSDKVKTMPMSEYVGRQYEEFLNRKILDKSGNVARYDSDKQMSFNQYFVNKYLEKELSAKVTSMVQKAKEDSEQTVLKTIEQTLKDQLAVDTIKRLNIPKMLENLQMKALEFEEANMK